MIRILIVDDHHLVRLGISRMLADIDDFMVVGEAESGEETLATLHITKPDVVLMDLNMPGIGGLETMRRLQRVDPQLSLIVLTVTDTGPLLTKVLESGAKGYLHKGCSLAELVSAIRLVHAGQRYISGAIASKFLQDRLSSAQIDDVTVMSLLSDRELLVMIKLLDGKSVREIAEVLRVSIKTIYTYRQRLFKKLGIKSDAGLSKFALRYNLMAETLVSRNCLPEA
jgi:two-component system, NarL family, invasion response regulator UvrY